MRTADNRPLESRSGADSLLPLKSAAILRPNREPASRLAWVSAAGALESGTRAESRLDMLEAPVSCIG